MTGTVSNLAQGMTKMQVELERVRGVEDYIRENERLILYIKSMEEKYEVPLQERYASIRVTSTPQQDASYQTAGGECLLPSPHHSPLASLYLLGPPLYRCLHVVDGGRRCVCMWVCLRARS